MSWWLVAELVCAFFAGMCFGVVAVALASANRHGGYIEPGRKS